MDLPRTPSITTTTTLPIGKTQRNLTEEDIRRIIREEIDRAA